MDSRAQDGPENGGWTRERRMGSRAQDGPENGGWTRERRMGSRAQDGPESGGWTRERSMDPRARNGFERRGWTSIKPWPSLFSETKKKDTKKRTDTIEPPDRSNFPKTWVLSYLTPTSPIRVRQAQSFQKTQQNKKKWQATHRDRKNHARSQDQRESVRWTRERLVDPRAISGPESD